MRARGTLIAIAFALASTTACGEKVDCNAFCAKEAACVAEIAIVLGTATTEQTKKLTDEDRKALGDRQRMRCQPNCTSPTKPSSVHSKWRKCLELQDCTEFAKCVYR